MRRYSVTIVSPGDCREDIIAIMRKNLSHPADEAIFPWRYENTPYGPARCWLARLEPGGVPVGSGALFPRSYCVGGNMRKVWVAGDFSVDREHRGFGPAFMLQRRILAEIQDREDSAWIYGVPNEKSRPVFAKLGYRTIGELQKYVKVLRSDYVYEKMNITPNFILKYIGKAIGALSRENLYRRPQGISVVTPDVFDSRFDSLWLAAKRRYPIVGERTAAFLKWRYSESSGKMYKIFGLTKDGILSGYVVYLVQDRLCHVADLFCIRDRKIVEYLLAEFSLRMRADGFDAISIRYFGASFLDKCLRKYHFMTRGKKNDQIMIYETDGSKAAHFLGASGSWYFLDGDRD